MAISKNKKIALAILLLVAATGFAVWKFVLNEDKSFRAVYEKHGYSNAQPFELLQHFTNWAREQRGRKKISKPHVIFISIDTLRADHLGSYGYGRNTSPFMDRLAADGVRFSNVISQSHKTMSSHMTMFTGLYPSIHSTRLGNLNNMPVTFKLDDRFGTLPEWLKKAGYSTAAWAGGGQMAPEAGFGRGFDKYVDNYFRFIHEEGMNKIREWFRENSSEPCFIFIHTYQVHSPYSAPEPYGRIFDPDYRGWVISDLSQLMQVTRRGLSMHQAFWGKAYERYGDTHRVKTEFIGPEDLKHIVALYDGNILYTDNTLTRFIANLIGDGLMDNTLLIITSDHGEEFMDHGAFLHADLYGEKTRVPLIFYYPSRLPGGKVVENQVRLIDLAPTILELVGLRVPGQVSGKSMLGMISRPKPDRPAYSEEPWVHETHHRTFRFENYVLYDRGEKGVELYDLRDDPGETTDISTENPEALKMMEIKMADFINGPEFKHKPGQENFTPVDEKRLQELRDLGYIE